MDRRDFTSGIGLIAIGAIGGYIAGARELLGIQSEEKTVVEGQEADTPTASDQSDSEGSEEQQTEPGSNERNQAQQISFEQASLGAPKPSDPWYIEANSGQHEISDAHATDGRQTLYLSGDGSLNELAVGVSVDLSAVAEVGCDLYIERTNPSVGDLALHIDALRDNKEIPFGGRTDFETGQFEDLRGDLSEYTGIHELYLRARGENGAYFDNLRFYDADGETIPPSEILIGNTDTSNNADAIAYYDFEGSGATIVDRSGNNHDGQLRNAERTSGQQGQGLAFERNENTYSELGGSGELVPGSDSYTISVYFRTTNAVGAGNQNKQRLVAVRGSSNERVVITLKGTEPRVTASFSEGGYNPDSVSADSDVTHVDGEWHHVVLQRDMEAQQIQLYIDGEQVDATDVTQSQISPEAPVYLGAQPDYPNPRYYTGQIDELRIYRAALTPDDLPT